MAVSYRNGLNYLESKTKVHELYDRFGARVAICPEWNGRVMTSTADGLDGSSYGLIHVSAIDSSEADPSFRFVGGEDQFTLSPEGGPFSLYYSTETEKSAPSTAIIPTDHISLPHGFQEGPFTVDSGPPSQHIRMRRSVQMTNLAGVAFDLDVVRTVRLMNLADIHQAFGSAVAVSLEQADLSYVGFETINSIINRGTPMQRESGLVSIRIRSMFNSGLNSVAIVPFRFGDEQKLGPSVCAEFFGSAPHGRLRVLPQAALLRADGKYRCQIGVSRKRVLPFLGALDFRSGSLTLSTFNLPSSPWEHDYLANEYCESVSNTVADFVNAREYFLTECNGLHTSGPEEDSAIILERDPEDTPYSGEVVRAYNNGPAIPGEPAAAQYFEFDLFSPARELNKAESLTHHQYTLHVNADNSTLSYIAKSLLNVDYERVYEKMLH